MLSKICSGTCIGIDAVPVEIEIDTKQSEKPTLVIVGLPDAAIREAKDRVQTAIRNTGHNLSCLSSTVNLAPADIKKEGTLFDLPIAIGILASAGHLPPSKLQEYLIVGELGLDGIVRPIWGTLALAMLAKRLNMKGIVVPYDNAQEAALIPGLEVIAIKSLIEAKDFYSSSSANGYLYTQKSTFEISNPEVDFAYIQGQLVAKRALEIAAAGGHNTLLFGPPGTGKSLLAKALIGILPKLQYEEALEVTKILSCSGQNSTIHTLSQTRPFRSPHHTITHAGMVGGGKIPRPGEIVLAHRGVLFLDELPEFSRNTLEALRQPLEERQVTISRAAGSLTFPSNFMFIAAMNPCPCGYYGHPEKPCRDSQLHIEKYQQRISGPLLDRIDIQIQVAPLKSKELDFAKAQECSFNVQTRVENARNAQLARWGNSKINSEVSLQEIVKKGFLSEPIKKLLDSAVDTLGISMRSYVRILRTALTIMDLAHNEKLGEEHILEALSYRQNIGERTHIK